MLLAELDAPEPRDSNVKAKVALGIVEERAIVPIVVALPPLAVAWRGHHHVVHLGQVQEPIEEPFHRRGAAVCKPIVDRLTTLPTTKRIGEGGVVTVWPMIRLQQRDCELWQ